MTLRKLIIGLVMGLGIVAVGAFSNPEPARAANYAVGVHPDQPRGPSLRFGINKLGDEDCGPNENCQNGISVRYYPTQFLVVSSTPQFSFNIQALSGNDSGTINPDSLRWEVYQLFTGNPQDGKLWDTLPGTFSDYYQRTGDPVSFGSTPQGTPYPNLKGYYVFLVKGIHVGDAGHGYVSRFFDLDGKVNGGATACPRAVDGNWITCPNEAIDNKRLQSFYISNNELNPAGRPQYLGTAPANISFTMRWSSGGNGNKYDYEDVWYWLHGFDIAHYPKDGGWGGAVWGPRDIHNHKNQNFVEDEVTHQAETRNQDGGNPPGTKHHDGKHIHTKQNDGDERHTPHGSGQNAHGGHTHAEPNDHQHAECAVDTNGDKNVNNADDNPCWNLVERMKGAGDSDNTYEWVLKEHQFPSGNVHQPTDHKGSDPNPFTHIFRSNAAWQDVGWGPGNYHEPNNGPAYSRGEQYRDVGYSASFSTAGIPCRADPWAQSPAISKKGTSAAYIANADWDLGPPQAPSFEGTKGYDDDEIRARVNVPGVIERGANGTAEISDTWTSDVWNISLINDANSQGGPLYRSETQSSTLTIKGWGSHQIHQGGPAFTTGRWPTCAPTNFEQFSPNSVPQNFYYNGAGSDTGVANTTLNFGFRYQHINPAFNTSSWQVQLADLSGNVRAVSGVGSSGSGQVNVGSVPIGDLNGQFQWRVCATHYPGVESPPPGQEPRNITWGCGSFKPVEINGGPRVQITSSGPTNGTGVLHNCDLLRATVTDPEAHTVDAQFTVRWSGPRGSGFRISNHAGSQIGPRPSGSEFTSDQVQVGGKTLTRFIREDIPDGSNVTWTVRGHDFRNTSDSQTNAPNSIELGTNLGYPGNRNLSSDWFWQGAAGFKWGPAATATYHRNVRPTFSNPPSTKEFYDLQGVRVPWLTDGQVTEVRVTLRNSGETPMKRYRIADYLGASRDFRQPGDFYLSYNGQPKYRVNPAVANVVVGNKQDPFNPAGGDRAEDPNNRSDDRGAAWRMDLGDNRTGQLRTGDLNPGEYLTFSYYVRADRNWTLRATQGTDPSNDPEGNYNRRYQVGNPTSQNTEGGAVDTSFAHVFAEYVEDYCDAAEPMVRRAIEFRPGDVLAPWLRTQRGSVHSNRNIEGYDGLPGANNATFVVTANGVLNHFSSPDSFPGYTPGGSVQTGNCADTPANGIDWRREMIKNTNVLFAGRKNDSPGQINQLTGNVPQRGDLNGPQGNVWVVGSPGARANLDLNYATQWRGVGTVVVYGDLTVNANQTYADSAGGVINSVGFIVMGNVRVNSSVTRMVGTYYVSDVNFQPPGPVNTANCPVIAPGTGTFVSATDATTANQQLNINGLVVARTFEFGRYFVNGSDAVLDPAENVYYDGRVISSTPPGFGTFRNTSAWYEIAP